MQEFLSRSFYGNTVADWSVALAIALAAFLLGKALYWMLSRVLRGLTKDTKTQIDDFIIDTIDEPTGVIVTVLGLWIAITTLTLPVGLVAWLWNVFQGTLVLAVTWMMVRLFEAFVRKVLIPLAEWTESDLDDQLLPILRRGGKISIWILGTIVALNNAGYDVAALIAGLGIGGLALAMPARKMVVKLGLTYDTSPQQMHRAMEILREIAEQHAADLAEGSRVAFDSFGDSSMNLLFVYHIGSGADILDTNTSVNSAILERFNAEGLEFAFPTWTVHTVPAAAPSGT